MQLYAVHLCIYFHPFKFPKETPVFLFRRWRLKLVHLTPSPCFLLCCFCLSDTPLCIPPPPPPHSCCQIKCQTDRGGGWMAHISPIEIHTMVQYVPVCALLFLSLLRPPSPPRPLHPGSLAVDWVVIVIKSSCTASESTKLSAYGWSSVGG